MQPITFIVELSTAVRSAAARMARGLVEARGLFHLHLILWPVDDTHVPLRQSGSRDRRPAESESTTPTLWAA